MSSETLRHVAIIMDGNNRWAKREKKQSMAGHKVGAERIRDVLAACRARGVEALTVFAFSSENWRRPPREVEMLMGLFYTYLKREAKKLAEERVRLKVIGNRLRFDTRLQAAINEAETIASQGDSTLVIAADYGGKWDIAQSAQALATQVLERTIQVSDIGPESLDTHLSTSDLPPLDMLIRTGGEQRISNFLLWQAAYAELYFSPLLWPDFGKNAMEEAIDDFYRRQRRFGLTGDQVVELQEQGGQAPSA